MKTSPNTIRIGAAAAVIVAVIVWLAVSGSESTKSYYVTIPEMGKMGDKAYKANLRVEGFVVPGSIAQNGTHVDFVLNEFESHTGKTNGQLLRVEYKGSEPPPDTFKDDAQALASGTYGRDGVFHASALQAKCASKYAPSQQPGAAPGSIPGSTPGTQHKSPSGPPSMKAAGL